MTHDFLRPYGGGGDQLPNYWNAQRFQPEVVLPTTNETRVTAGLGAWSSWVQIVASTAADYILAHAHVASVTTASMSKFVQIGIGAAGSEVVIAEFALHAFISGSGSTPMHFLSRRLAPYKVPSGSRLAARAWTTAGDGRVALLLSVLPSPPGNWRDPWPNTYIEGARVTKTRRDPAVAGWHTLQSASWTQIVASAPNDMLFVAAEYDPANASGGQGQWVEVGVGAAGSEQILSRVPFPTILVFNWNAGYQEAARKGLILAGERVAARLRTGTDLEAALYFEDL